MHIGIPREIHPGELRVAATPDVVSQLIALGFPVSLEAGAGTGANCTDEAYRKVGATIVDDVGALYSASDVILKVRAPEAKVGGGGHELDLLRAGHVLICFLWPGQNQAL
jgi:NAD(P) transhydrogenase subunit alpha